MNNQAQFHRADFWEVRSLYGRRQDYVAIALAIDEHDHLNAPKTIREISQELRWNREVELSIYNLIRA